MPKKETVTKANTTLAKSQKTKSLAVPSYSLEGKEEDSLTLPEKLFGAKVNRPLLSQALRVYLSNQKAHFSNTKTRGEVQGSTKKIRRQKGTGGARHGAIRAPIFVGGGIALGPKFRKVVLSLPKKMKKAALVSALSAKAQRGEVAGISGLEKISGKTAQVAGLFKRLNKKSALIVADGKDEKLSWAVRNLPGIEVLTVDQLNALSVIRRQTLMMTREAVKRLEEKISGDKSVLEVETKPRGRQKKGGKA